VKAVVLVGGEGTRLRPLTRTVPKPLLPIAGQPFLERQLHWLAGHGVDEAVLSLGYLPDAFVAHFPDGEHAGVRLHYAVEATPLGTAGGIRFAARSAGIDDRFVVCNGDVLTTLDLSGLVRFHAEHGAEATIHLTSVDDPSAFGVVPTYDDGEVQAFVEKPLPGTAPTSWINAGTYVLEPSVLDGIPDGLPVSIERETFPRLLERRGRLFAHGTDDYWLDIGTPEKYLQAQRDTITGCVGLPPVVGAAELAPGVWAQEGVEIAPSAVVEPPSLLGAGTVLERGARVEAATVLGSAVETDAILRSAVILEGVRIGEGALVEDSIIGPGAEIGPEAVISGLSIVAAGARIAPGTVVDGGRVELSPTAS
jgi:mannose-1-phosphate guanylyltransferase